MNLQEIKQAIADGKKVKWASDAYDVIKDNIGQYLIICNLNEYTIGLTHQDKITMNGKEDQFYIENEEETQTEVLFCPDCMEIVLNDLGFCYVCEKTYKPRPSIKEDTPSPSEPQTLINKLEQIKTISDVEGVVDVEWLLQKLDQINQLCETEVPPAPLSPHKSYIPLTSKEYEEMDFNHFMKCYGDEQLSGYTRLLKRIVFYQRDLLSAVTPSPSPSQSFSEGQGWWSISYEGVEPSECSLEHIGRLVTEGYNQGEIIEHTDDNN